MTRKPKLSSVADILEQFENLGVAAESDGDLLTAGMCFKSGATCAAVLSHHSYCAMLMLRAARLFITDPHHVTTAQHCYSQAIQRYGEVSSAQAGAICCELASKLRDDMGAALLWLEKAAVWLNNAPLERLNCHMQMVDVHIRMGNMWAGLETCRVAVTEITALAPHHRTADISTKLQHLQITRVLLLLILQTPTPQMNEDDRKLLEELTWGSDSTGSTTGELDSETLTVLQSCLHDSDTVPTTTLPPSLTSQHLTLIHQLRRPNHA